MIAVATSRMEVNVGKHTGRRTLLGSVGVLVVGGIALLGNVALERAVNDGIDILVEEESKSGPAVAASVPSEAASPTTLLAFTRWPTVEGCDAGTVVAMPNGGPPAEDVHFEGADPRAAIIAAGGGAYGPGNLTIDLTTDDGDTAFITGIEVEVFQEIDPPSWRYILTSGGCGEAYSRLFVVDLDDANPYVADEGLVGPQELESVYGPAVPVAPFGEAFTVSTSEPARVRILAHSCSTSVEWGVVIHYVTDGEEHTLPVGTADDPFITLAGGDPELWMSSEGALTRYGSDDGSDGVSQSCR